MRPIVLATRGKGALNLARRAAAIGGRYGFGVDRMEDRLTRLLEILDRTGSGATLPITAATAARHPSVVDGFASRGIEFAVHGYYHVDHSALRRSVQIQQLDRARRVLEGCGADVSGFRAPYLRWNAATLGALRENGFEYDSSQAVDWPIAPLAETEAYRRGLRFCAAMSASDHPAVPQLDAGLVRIPCSLPDDEALVDRLHVTSSEVIAAVWLQILAASHERGELFTLAVHPERIDRCAAGVAAVLQAANRARPSVWVTRLTELARWWRQRAAARVDIIELGDGALRVVVRGPAGATLLARGLHIPDAQRWGDPYVRAPRGEVQVRVGRRPFIGVSPSSPPALASFLREQGYIVETAASGSSHAVFIHRDRFTGVDRRSLLSEVERAPTPLLRLGRWPDGARSALCITGDVDALTIWDYAARFVGR